MYMLLLSAALQAAALPVQAQAAPATPCSLIVVGADSSGEFLGVACGGPGVWLGRVKRHQAVLHAQTGALALVLEGIATMQVLVVSPGSDGRALVEDITGGLAQQAGRSRDGRLAASEINLGRFAGEGVIAAHGAPARAGDGQFSIIDSLAAEAKRKALPVGPPPVLTVQPTGQGPSQGGI